MRMRALVVGIAVSLLWGCSGDDLLLVVDLRTDLVPGVEFSSVRTIVETGTDSGSFVDVLAPAGADFVGGQRVAELSGLSTGPIRIRVEAQTEEGTVVAARPVAITLTESLGVTVVLSRACLGVTCPLPDGDPVATACLGDTCGDPACTVETPDACGEPACTVASDCAEGPACAPRVCSGGVCLGRPDDAACGVEEFCDPDAGCRPAVNAALPAQAFLRMVEEKLVSGETRRTADGNLVGDLSLAETGPRTFDFVVRGARLVAGVPMLQPNIVPGTATIEEDGRWFMIPDDSAEPPVVATVTIDGRRWTFANDLADPRTDPAFGEYVIAEVDDAPTREQVGGWTMVSYEVAGIAYAAGECVPGSGSGSTSFTHTLDLDENNQTTLHDHLRDFTDGSCMTPAPADPRDLVGFTVQEGEGTAAAYLWDTGDGTGFFYSYSYTLATDGSMSLLPISCLPAPCGSAAEALTFDTP